MSDRGMLIFGLLYHLCGTKLSIKSQLPHLFPMLSILEARINLKWMHIYIIGTGVTCSQHWRNPQHLITWTIKFTLHRFCLKQVAKIEQKLSSKSKYWYFIWLCTYHTQNWLESLTQRPGSICFCQFHWRNPQHLHWRNQSRWYPVIN